ncbi:MAG TPA: membrane protein insertase YidC [Verrucomicrobiae bacterium]|nr:membrane protein insertase YidC [Verrucomicrobiae bacterium]
MDRKSIVVIIACIGFMFLWSGVLVPKYFTKPAPPGSNIKGTNAPSAGSTSGTNVPATVTTSPSVPTNAPFVRPTFATNTAEQLIVLTNENARYTFTSQGGGLKQVELWKFPETISRKIKSGASTNGLVTLNENAQLPVLAIIGGDDVHGDGLFTLTQTGDSIRAEKTLPNGLRLVKKFQLSTNYLLNARVRWENASSNAIALPQHEWVVGTATPMNAFDDASAVGVMWYDGGKTHETTTPYFENKRFGCLPGTPRSEYRDGNSNIVWAVAHNQFFALVAMPDVVGQQIIARAINLPRPSEGRFSFASSPLRKGFETTMVYPGFTVAPGATVERDFNLYAGPKEYRTLAAIAGRLENNLDQVMGFGIFGFISKILLLAMNWLNEALKIPYGWAIIVITVLLKILFWPLTAASTRSAQRMASFAPQLNALKEKYKDDPQKFAAKQMEFFRENKINPVSGCLPMFVQLPVFFGLFAMLRTAIELRGAHFLWATDLSRSDTLFTIPIPGLDFFPLNLICTPEGIPLNLLPLLYIASAIWQTHMTPMSPGMDPTQQKLMRWMPLMFLAILYNFSSGLALYMTVNNLLTILQTWLMKRNAPPPAAAAAPAKVSVLTPASKKKK